MANVYAVATGSWSAPATWNTGSLPASNDDVYPNGFTVTIDQDVTVVSLRNTAVAGIAGGGNFTLQAGRTLNANLYGGTTTLVNFTQTGTSIINGTIQGGSTGYTINQGGTASILHINGDCIGGSNTAIPAVILGGTNAQMIITGNCIGGTGNISTSGAWQNSATSALTINGNVTASGNSAGVYVPATGPVIVNGNVTGGPGTNSYGLYVNVNGGNVTINGNVTGGNATSAFGLLNNLAATVTINGYAIGGPGSLAVQNSGTGTVRVTVAKGSDTGHYVGLFGVNSLGVTTYERAEAGTFGTAGFLGYARMKPGSNSTITVRMEDGTYKTMVITDQVANGQPAASDVRSGVEFDFGNKTGTCAVPLASQVLTGVPIDNTVGTAMLTAASVRAAVLDADVTTLTAANSIGERLKNCSTVETTGSQFTSLNV